MMFCESAIISLQGEDLTLGRYFALRGIRARM